MSIFAAILGSMGGLLKNWKVLVVLAVLLCIAGGAFAVNRFVKGYEDQIAEKEQVIADLTNDIDNLKVDLLQANQEKASYQTVIDRLRDDLASTGANKVYLDMELEKSLKEIAAMRKRLADQASKEKSDLYSGDVTLSQKAVDEFNAEINGIFSEIEGK